MLLIPDMNKEFVLDTDASSYALGAILQQNGLDYILQVVTYASKTKKGNGRYKKEAYAIIWAVMHFHEYLRFCPF